MRRKRKEDKSTTNKLINKRRKEIKEVNKETLLGLSVTCQE
jgi:hypothetical protein